MGLESELSLSGSGSGSGSGSDDCNFGFAFNDVNFSDRLLRIEVTRCGEVSCSRVVDCVRDRKRRREEDVENNETQKVLDLATCEAESDNNKHEEERVMTEQESESESESGGGDETNLSVMRVKELHISSPILAAKSPFFYKLFSNGMLESEKKHVTLKIDASEEAAVMELLKFMYSNSLTFTTVPALLDVLMAADKFEVASCMTYCCRLLLTMPMTLDSALLLLDLPSSLLMADSVKHLINVANHFISSRYKDISKLEQEEVMALTLVGIKAILASDDLQVASEDIVYDFVVRWARLHYSVLGERQDIIASHLAPYIRFPYMTCRRLKQILTSDDFRPSLATSLVLEALFFKTGSLDHEEQHPADSSLNRRFVERTYTYRYRPVKTVEFKAPHEQCIVYFDLKRKECESLYPSKYIMSQTFFLGGQWFFLSAHCNMDQLNTSACFGLFLWMHDKGSASKAVEYQFAARLKPTDEFKVRCKRNYTLNGGQAVGLRDLFAMPWDSFIAEDCPYFINDVLHLRVELSIRRL